MSTLTAYYDLNKNPPSFNFVDFLLLAERERIRLGLEKIQVRIFSGSYDGFRCDKLPPYGPEERGRWLQNIVIPMAKLLPSCGEEAKMYDPAETPMPHQFGRGRYLVGLHHNVDSAHANCYPLRADPEMVKRWMTRGKFVTITMREVDWWPDRRTPLDQWRVTAEKLKDQGFNVVFIRDACKAQEKVEGFDTAPPETSLRSDERAAIYTAAWQNIFIPSGPLMMAWFMGVPCIMFKPLCGHSTVAAWKGAGIAPGAQFANSKPGQHFVWSGDDPEFICETLIQYRAKRTLEPAQVERKVANG